jgi:hypothetical protein
MQLPDKRFIADSANMARTLEELFPNPPLYLNNEKVINIGSMVPDLTSPLRNEFLATVPRTIIAEERSASFFIASREKMYGCPWSDIEKQEGEGSGWAKCRPAWDELVRLLKEEEGPFFLGTKRK